MKAALLLAAALGAAGVAGALAGPASAAPKLVIRRAAMNIAVVPEARSDIAVQIWRPNAQLPLYVERVGGDVVIDGRLLSFFTRCHGSGQGLRVFVLGRGDYGIGQMPQVLVRVPMDAVVASGGVVHGVVARTNSLTLDTAGCGDWTVANVAGPMSANVSGVGDVRTGASRSAEVSLSGTGNLTLGPVQGQLVAHLSGAGSVNVRAAGAADIAISGTGGFATGPIGGPLSAHLSGAGSLKTASVSGAVTADVSGVGHVTIAGGHATSLNAVVSGTGSIAFQGVADSLDAEVSGVGSVDVARVTGQVEQHVSGVGSVHVGGR